MVSNISHTPLNLCWPSVAKMSCLRFTMAPVVSFIRAMIEWSIFSPNPFQKYILKSAEDLISIYLQALYFCSIYAMAFKTVRSQKTLSIDGQDFMTYIFSKINCFSWMEGLQIFVYFNADKWPECKLLKESVYCDLHSELRKIKQFVYYEQRSKVLKEAFVVVVLGVKSSAKNVPNEKKNVQGSKKGQGNEKYAKGKKDVAISFLTDIKVLWGQYVTFCGAL